ncbi:MAG: signal peptide peptidase SppA [Gammaproteobacteria bacterium]|jgi:protease-4|nr:signal peptide peptidase SppA [Gammaproteobacteria bacterium]MBP6052981.1 signal peptide peptidase SppA [Pseudomonadales bacterium]MBK6584001.1 signal peptide peptidase SppA [Gammaproteobacteria bacterium]MBK7169287.1 signal peptide peptidase SppA [Gammaproteobacteria bacterium]MBK7522506.1 signal peptide peptidase SppA [Gammaproteobacteria bacterium]
MTQERKSLIRRFFGGLWALLTWLRTSLANLFFLLFIAIAIVMFSADRGAGIPERAALVVDPSGRVVEQLSIVDPLAQLLGGAEGQDRETLLKDILDAIVHARDDQRIGAIVLATDALKGAGITKTRDIAAALEAFRSTGRKIIAIGDSYSQDQYLLAAQADEIWMHPMGMVDLSGYAAYRNYYGDALEKLKIDLHVFRSGTFKSAFEFMERGNMSDADRIATGSLLQEIWSAYTGVVTVRRKLPAEAVDHYANGIDAIFARHGGDAGAAAMEYGFVDSLMTRGEMDATLAEMVGEDDEGHFSAVNFRDYLSAVRPVFELDGERGEAVVGVIVASGMILDGKQPAGNVGGDSLAALVREAARDDSVKALVLRIDSPGGSGFASEIIREALLEFRATGKPLVASMGSVAASGGYWIAAPADEIWASATTLTGSIGVLSAFPSIARGLNELGINNDGLGTTSIAGGMDLSRPLSPQLEAVLRMANEHTYRRFVDIVADGRKMSPEKVEEVAQGRAWTGTQAQANGLVDQLGNLEQALAAAARLAKLDSYDTRYIEEPASWSSQLLARLSLSPDTLLGKALSGAHMLYLPPEPLTLLGRLQDPRSQYAICTVCAVF